MRTITIAAGEVSLENSTSNSYLVEDTGCLAIIAAVTVSGLITSGTAAW